MKDDADSPWADRAGRGGGRAKPHGLVRPYVLNQGGSDPRRPVYREASENPPRGHQPTLDWAGDLDSPRRSESAQAPEPARRSAGNHRALNRKQRKLAAIGAGVAALVIVGGVVLFLSRPASKPLAGACNTAGCTKPAAGAPAPKHKAIRRPQVTATRPTVRPSRTPRATPTPSPTPAPPLVKVGFTVVRQHPHSLLGRFTIVNEGSTPINGWELVVVLPGDDIRSVSNGSFHTKGDTLYIDPSQSERTIAPGATLTENFTAHGSTTTVTSCTFNGAAC